VIPVKPQPEPEDFDKNVRQKGLKWMQDKCLDLTQPKPEKIKLEPYWRDFLEQLHSKYGGVCAYVCVYIERISGTPSADHFVPKSADLKQAYEWDNYRLACLRMNARKNNYEDVLDPLRSIPIPFSSISSWGVYFHLLPYLQLTINPLSIRLTD
jgi:5-methylcytosine-specific restriction endonuclease McrA